MGKKIAEITIYEEGEIFEKVMTDKMMCAYLHDENSKEDSEIMFMGDFGVKDMLILQQAVDAGMTKVAKMMAKAIAQHSDVAEALMFASEITNSSDMEKVIRTLDKKLEEIREEN